MVSKLGSGSARGFALARDQVFYFSNSSIILPGLQAFIGVTCSYFSCPFLCAFDSSDFYILLAIMFYFATHPFHIILDIEATLLS